jgi:hypothetical protein
LLVVFVNCPTVRAAQLDRMGDDSCQHGFKVERGADRLTNFAQRSQLTDRLHELARPCFQFLEQPHVLDRDYRLVGEGFKQLDLRRRERLHLVATSGQYPNKLPLLMKGHAQKRTESGEDAQRWKIILGGSDVGNVERAMLAHPTKPWLIKTHLESPIGYGYRTKMSSRNDTFPFAESQRHIIDPTDSSGALDDGVEDRLHVRGQAADNAEHLGRCRLVLQGFAQFCVTLLQFFEQSHVLDRDHRLVCEGLEERNLFVSERTRLDSSNKDRAQRCTLPEQRDGQPSPG